MKKTQKIILIIMFIFLAICQINTEVFALSEEVKKEVKYEEGIPEEYDIQINGSDLTVDIKIPSIAISLKDILYGKEDWTDINFFDTDNQNIDPYWTKFRGIVRDFFRGTLYVSIALTLTFLIYMAVKIVIASISGKEGEQKERPRGGRGKWGNIFRSLRSKKFVEQWITCFISLALVVIVINIIISFSELLMNDVTFSDIEDQNIKVYVKGGVITTSKSISGGATSLMFIGDSRMVQLEANVDTNDSDIFISKGAQGYQWMVDEAFPQADSKIRSGMKVIIWLGVNDTVNIDYYIKAVNEKAAEWKSKGVSVAYATVGPGTAGNLPNSVPKFNEKLKEELSEDIQIIDVYEFLQNDGYNSDDGIHYQSAALGDYGKTYTKVYNYMVDQALNGSERSSSVKEIKDFSFETNEEGLFVFQTHYNWSENATMNFRFLIYAGIMLVCRVLVYAVFIFRTMMIGFIIIISPILILFNSLYKIGGNAGFLRKWVVLFFYLIFLGFGLKIIFNLLANISLYSVVEHPVYIVAVHAIILAVLIASIIKIIKYLIGKEKKKK